MFRIPQLQICVRACFALVLVCDRASFTLIVMFVNAFFRTRNIHTLFYTRAKSMFMAAFFRTRNIHILHSPVYLCLPLGCLGVSLVSVGTFFLERGVFTHPLRQFICVRLIISVHGCFTAVTVRYEPSRIVAVRANLTTRLGIKV